MKARRGGLETQVAGRNRNRFGGEAGFTVQELRRENDRLRRENDKLRKQVEEQAEQIVEKEEQIAEKEEQIANLERQLAAKRQNSTNSSKPPSSDGLAGEPRQRGRKKKSKRRPGGQPGHQGAHRPLAPPERVNQIEVVLPGECRHCGLELAKEIDEVKTTGQVHRHQVVELPPIEAHIIEYQCYRVVCPGCEKSTRASIPEQARGQTGERLTALVSYLTVVCRVPRRVVEALLEQALGIEISLGTTQQCWEQASAAVEEPCRQLESELANQPVLNVDETGWRNNAQKRYLWAFVATSFVYYAVAPTRGSQWLQRILGPVYAGILCSDRFSGYLKYHKGTAQFCWAHLKRNILGVFECGKKTEVERFCRDALALHARLFRLWHKYRQGLIDRPTLISRSMPLQKRFFDLGERHLDSTNRQVSNLAMVLFVHNERLFVFLEHEQVEPTNNSAERALRIGVQWRKTSFGNRSTAGEIATARLLTVTQTCRLQGLNALAYLTEAIRCYRRRQPVAPPLPGPAGLS